MKQSAAERAVLSAGKSVLSRARDIRRKQEKQTELFLTGRQRAASGFKRQLLDKALQAAGIDRRSITERQTLDQQAVAKYLETERDEALARAGTVNSRQDAAMAERRTRWNKVLWPGSTVSAAPVSLYVDTATDIVLSREGTTSIAPGQNLAHTMAHISSGGYLGGPMKGQFANIDWHFMWQPPRDGLLNATGFLQMNGASWLAINSDCNGGAADSSVEATLGLTQLDAAGKPHSDTQSVNLLDQRISTSWGDSLGKVQFITLDESDTVGYRAFQFPALAELSILITVSVSLYVFVWNAQSALDFLSGDYRLNVPFVFLSLQAQPG